MLSDKVHIYTVYNGTRNVHVADAANPFADIVVSMGEKLNLRCSSDVDVETTWWKNGEALRSTARIRVTKQFLKLKYAEMEDAGVYGCRLQSDEAVDWRNVTVRIENLQNDGFQGEGEETSDAIRPEEEINDLETETRSELSGKFQSELRQPDSSSGWKLRADEQSCGDPSL